MLSTAAFNGLLKTLEEPPEHVKFIFATTEIRKVPITVLSRCQRFDLRRIEAGEMTDHLNKIAGLENIEAEAEALAMIARAGEGSARDALSLLDQAIAHSAGSGGGKIEAGEVRQMLGLADRARVIDLFEHVMKGDIAAALAEIKEQYDVGADPATVLTNLAEFVHFVTRVRYVDTALNDPSLSEEEKTRGKTFAEKLSPRILGRAWQMLLKGIAEVQSSSRPLAAADMVLVRITHAADLPTPDEALKAMADGGQSGGTMTSGASSGVASGRSGGGTSAVASGAMNTGGSGATMKQVANGGPALVVDNQPAEMMRPEIQETSQPEPAVAPDLKPVYDKVETFQDLLNLAEKKRDIRFKLMLRNNFSQIEFEPGRIEFCPVGNPPKDIVNILQARLREWTGKTWDVVTSEAVGEATIKEVEVATREKNFNDAAADPTVAAVLKTFPKSKIVDVRFPNADVTDGLDESAVLEAGLENPDANDDIDEDAVSETGDPGAGGLDDYF